MIILDVVKIHKLVFDNAEIKITPSMNNNLSGILLMQMFINFPRSASVVSAMTSLYALSLALIAAATAIDTSSVVAVIIVDLLISKFVLYF